MTTKQDSNENAWINEYMAAERRRNLAYGAGIVIAALLITAAIIYYFSSTAAMPW